MLCHYKRACMPVLSLGVGGGASVGNLFALLFPAEDGFAYARHRLLRDAPRLLRSLVDHFQHALRILLILHAALANWRNPLDQIVRHRRFALDAADARGATAFR